MKDFVMICRILCILVILPVSLLVFNSGDLHSCDDNGDHEPVCSDCACIFCSTGLIGIIDSPTAPTATNYLLGHLAPGRKLLKYGELAFEIDQPPKA